MRFEREVVEDALDEIESCDDGDRTPEALEAIKAAIKELAKAALDLTEEASRLEGQRARGYWYAHIVGALDDQHGYCGGSMMTMQSSADSLREAEADGWGTKEA